jgi:hypothetical protein
MGISVKRKASLWDLRMTLPDGREVTLKGVPQGIVTVTIIGAGDMTLLHDADILLDWMQRSESVQSWQGYLGNLCIVEAERVNAALIVEEEAL